MAKLNNKLNSKNKTLYSESESKADDVIEKKRSRCQKLESWFIKHEVIVTLVVAVLVGVLIPIIIAYIPAMCIPV